jgi:hypothetical protein
MSDEKTRLILQKAQNQKGRANKAIKEGKGNVMSPGERVDMNAKNARIRRLALSKAKKIKDKSVKQIKSNAKKEVAKAKKDARELVKKCKELDDKKKQMKKDKPKRPLTEYQKFVQRSMLRAGIKSLPPKDRLKRIGFLWRQNLNPNPTPLSNQ